MLVDPASNRQPLTTGAIRPVASAGVAPAGAALAAGLSTGGKKPRYFARLPMRQRLLSAATPGAGAAPLDCWHVWLADGLVPDAAAPAADWAGLFDRAAAIAAERAAAYRDHQAQEEVPANLPRLDLQA